MTVAEIVRLCVDRLLDLFWQRVNETARREPHVNLLLFFFRNTADLKHLTSFATGRIRPTGGFVFLREKSDRAARLGQTIRMKIAAIVGDKLLNSCSRDLRDQVVDFLIICARVQWFYDVPM